MEPPRQSGSAPHTPSPASSRSQPPSSALGAPVKASGGRGFSDTDGDLDSPSKSGEKVARRKGRAARRQSLSEGAISDEGGFGDTPPRRLSVSLTFTPIRSSQSDTQSAPTSLAKQPQDVKSAVQSSSKAETYVAPHRRSAPSPITPVSYSRNHFEHYDRSNAPPSEDHYYQSPPNRRSAPLVSAFSSYDTSPAHTQHARSSPGGWRYQAEFPSPAPPAAMISRGPYNDPAAHPHPAAIPEELDATSVSSWADEVERSEQELTLPDLDDEDQPFYSPMPWPPRKGSAEEEDLEFLVRIGKRKGSSAFITNSGIDVPSPVWEENFDEEDIKIPARKSSVVSSRTVKGVSIQATTLLGGTQDQDNVCTGCGSPPVPSFVALTPCDHLVCHLCLNALINATAHKPPRPMTCFACESRIKSFLPAWEGVGAAGGGRIGLVEAFKETLRNGDSRKATAEDSISPPHDKANRRRSSTGATVALQPLPSHEYEADKENRQVNAEQAPQSKSRRRSIAASSTDESPAGHGAHLLSPLSLKSKRSQSVMASGSLSQVEYSGGSPSQSRKSGPRSRSNSASEVLSSTPPRRKSTSTGPRRSSGRFSRSSLGDTDTGTPDLSTSFTPFKLVELIDSAPTTPEGGPDDRSAAVVLQQSNDWELLESIKAQAVDKVAVSAEVLTESIEWPVVRLDNIPWDVTVAEVEDWLPAESLAPVEKCVMAVHILCNRSDGRTLNQCYVEAASVAAARLIVRTRDGHKLCRRPVHVTLSSQGELLTTLFPTYEPGFSGLVANRGNTPCPLLMQTELTGLLSLCKLESPHACKVKERPYLNIVSILQKFPWDQPWTWNSQQVVRLFNSTCAAIEILDVVRNEVVEWHEILTVFADAILACPGFRSHQKAKLLRKTGLHHSRFPDLTAPKRHPTAPPFSFSPPSLRESYVTVAQAGLVDEGSTNPAALLSFAPDGGLSYDSDASSPFTSPERRQVTLPTNRLSKTTSTPSLFSSSLTPTKLTQHRRVSDIAKQLGVNNELVKAVAEKLGLGVGSSMKQ